jgi:hypothetical protein
VTDYRDLYRLLHRLRSLQPAVRIWSHNPLVSYTRISIVRGHSRIGYRLETLMLQVAVAAELVEVAREQADLFLRLDRVLHFLMSLRRVDTHESQYIKPGRLHRKLEPYRMSIQRAHRGSLRQTANPNPPSVAMNRTSRVS